VSLVDVPAGAGGFVCVPGSHRSNFACPDGISLYDAAPVVHNVSVKAGDCVLFTELLRHGGRRWTLEEPRRTVFVRYSTSYASWSPGVGPIPEYRHMLSDDVAELMTMLGHQGCKRVVKQLLELTSSGSS
jgi:ectoine hydroxylase-related dioxygenase (phytanoyl-CoA dioxygenase family)